MGGGRAAYKWGRLLAGVYGIYLTGHNAEQREGFRQTSPSERLSFTGLISDNVTCFRLLDNKKSCAKTTVELWRDG